MQYFFYGSSFAFLTVGILNDWLLKAKSPFLLMSFFVGLEIGNAGILLTSIEKGPTKYLILGFLQTIIHTLMLVAIPLILAARYRDFMSVKDLPVAG